MKDIFNKLKMPTILGLGIIILGIISGVFLTLREQVFISSASPSASPQNITLTNISDTQVSISWQTSIPITSFISFGKVDPNEVTVLDDRDTHPAPYGAGPTPYLIHYVTIKNLTPKTTYLYKIISGKLSSQTDRFTTAAPLTSQTGFRPIIGSVLDGNKPLEEGIVYLSITDATIQSALVVSSGNFLIPISQIRTADSLTNFPLTEDTLAKLTIVSPKGQATAQFRLKDSENGLPPLKLGQDLDFTDIASGQDLKKYDLNEDGKINAADNAIILDNLGRNPKNKEADINKDGIVDQKDLDLMAQKINELGSQ